MQLELLKITKFRNLPSVEFRPDPGINFITGSNGQGKTSILEAIAVLASLRSFRESKPVQWVLEGSLGAALEARLIPSLETSDWKTAVRVALNLDTNRSAVRKAIQVNDKPVRSSAQYLRMKFGTAEMAFHTIAFNPSDHDLIRGDPAGRRAHLDRVISAESSGYFENLIHYNKLLEQRNSLLKEGSQRLRQMLPEFTEPLLEIGSRLTAARLAWLHENAASIARIATSIAPRQPTLELSYSIRSFAQNRGFFREKQGLSRVHFTGHQQPPSLEDLRAWHRIAFNELAADELRLGSTLVGPHRDDWAVEFRGESLKGRGSQGEVRTALLALKLGEIESFRRNTGHRPILLLDDFSSELDLERRRFLMKFLEATDLQVFITSTEVMELPGARYSVADGRISELSRDVASS